MTGAFSVATPSESNSLEPVFPGVLAMSFNVIPSENIFLFMVSSRNDIFCWIEVAFSAFMMGDTSLDATFLSTTILYLPLLRFFGPIWLIALRRAVIPHSCRSRPSYSGDMSHQYPLYLLPSLSAMVISEKQEKEVSV